ncbi:hypothetical protein OF83DRAFT_1068447, partial [Amylostereum chailletii]
SLREGYKRVSRWTKNFDLFEKKYLLVPVHDIIQQHWYLLIVLWPGRVIQVHPGNSKGGNENNQPRLSDAYHRCKILILDSLGKFRDSAAQRMSEYLQLEAYAKRNVPLDQYLVLKVLDVHVAQQPNNVDCGVFLLHFARLFMSQPLKCLNAIKVLC